MAATFAHRNRLLQRVRRHGRLTTLFRTAHDDGALGRNPTADPRFLPILGQPLTTAQAAMRPLAVDAFLATPLSVDAGANQAPVVPALAQRSPASVSPIAPVIPALSTGRLSGASGVNAPVRTTPAVVQAAPGAAVLKPPTTPSPLAVAAVPPVQATVAPLSVPIQRASVTSQPTMSPAPVLPTPISPMAAQRVQRGEMLTAPPPTAPVLGEPLPSAPAASADANTGATATPNSAPHSVTPRPSLPHAATPTSELDATTWRRLQLIMRKHKEKEAQAQMPPVPPTVPPASLPAMAPSAEAAKPSTSAPTVNAPSALQHHPAIGPAAPQTATPPPAATSAAGTGTASAPTGRPQGAVAAIQRSPAPVAATLPATAPIAAPPASPSVVAPFTITSQHPPASLPPARTLPSSVTEAPGTLPSGIPLPVLQTEERLVAPEPIAPVMESASEEVIQPLPLEAAWPVQRVAQPPAHENASSTNATMAETAVDPPPAGLPPALSAAVQAQLDTMPPAQTTESRIELVLPRRPRPVQHRPAVAAPTTPAVSTTPPPNRDADPLTTEADAPPAASATPPAITAGAEPTAIATAIGPLPAHLWRALGEAPPVQTESMQTAPMGLTLAAGMASGQENLVAATHGETTLLAPLSVAPITHTDAAATTPPASLPGQRELTAAQTTPLSHQDGAVVPPLVQKAEGQKADYTGAYHDADDSPSAVFRANSTSILSTPVTSTPPVASLAAHPPPSVMAPVQRTSADGPDANPGPSPMPPAAVPTAPSIDTDELARQVYRELKRYLVVERERLGQGI